MNGNKVSQAVILAGGLGTRLKPFTDDNPKPMYPFEGKPFIEYLILQIKEFGIKKVLILLGYMPEKISDCLGDGSRYGIAVSYDITPVEYNTADRLLHAKEQLEERFLLMYCDNYCPINFSELVWQYEENQAWIQISVYENRDEYTKSNLLIGENGEVQVYDKKRLTPNLQGVDIGYAIIEKKVLEFVKDKGVNFEASVYPDVITNRKMFATVTKHRYYSVSSWERIELTRQFFANRPAVFLDRDGTLNVKAPKACYIEKPEQFVWLDGAKTAIKLLKNCGFIVILITNQPGIARGNLTEETLGRIHKKMQEELQKDTGYQIDAIYYCPHDWDEGCECRKPKPGMLYQAQKDFSLNMTKCVLIGDDDRDIEAGEAAGCITYQVTEDRSLLQIVKEMVKTG